MLVMKEVTEKSAEYPEIEILYKEAFPKKERSLLGFFENRAVKGKADFLSFFSDNQLVGFAYVLRNEDLAYIFYLAIKKQMRDKGYGSEILSLLKDKYNDKTISLVIEPVETGTANYEQRRKRRLFYEKNGFTLQKERMKYAKEYYEVMCFKGKINDLEFQKLLSDWLPKLWSVFINMKII